jgi:hypothetical protein
VFPLVANHQTFVSVYAGDRLLREGVLTAEHRVTRVYARGGAGTLAVLRTFGAAGIHHIAVGPDHILFVLGLLLLGGELVHGFGFAGVLAEFGLPREALGWSLAAFNVGVEIGQACLVALVAPALFLLARREPALHARAVRVLALGIATAGGFWFVQRLLTQ